MSVAFLAVSARIISPEAFGVFAVVNVVLTIVMQLSEAGFGAALVQRPKYDQSHIVVAFWGSILVATIFFALLWALAPYIESIYSDDVRRSHIRAAGAVLIVSAFSIVPQSLLQRDFQFRDLFFANVAAFFLGHILLGISLALAGWGVWALILAVLGTRVVFAVVVWIRRPIRTRGRWVRLAVSELTVFGFSLVLIRILNSIAENVDRLVLGLLAPMSSVGILERAIYAVKLPLIYVGHIVDAPLFSTLSRTDQANGQAAEYFLRMLAFVALTGAILAMYAVLFSDVLVNILLGDQWGDAVALVSVLGGLIFLNLIARLCDVGVRAHNRMLRSFPVKFAYAVLVIAGTWIGWSVGALIGAAAGILIASAIHSILMLHAATDIMNLGAGRVAQALGPAVIVTILLFGKTTLVLSQFQDSDSVLLQLGLLVVTVFTDGILLLIAIRMFPSLLGGLLQPIVSYFRSRKRVGPVT